MLCDASDLILSENGIIGIEADGDVDDGDVVVPVSVLLKLPNKSPDWPKIIEQIKDRFNLSYAQLAKILGMTPARLNNIGSERCGTDDWDRALLLFGIFTMNISNDPPLMGDAETEEVKD